MTAPISRRTLLGIAAAGVAGAATGLSMGGVRACRGVRRDGAVASGAAVADYVDHHGWILTPADERALAGVPRDVGR